jgi:hypothetical protein
MKRTVPRSIAGRALLLALACAGCGRGPDKVADRFVDLYFVETDQVRARELASGLAAKKLDDEIKLVTDVRRTVDPDAAKPTVFYTRHELRVQGDRANATYDVTVQYGGDLTRKNAMVSLERIGGAWRVANFTVAEGHLPPRPEPTRPSP